MAAVPGGCREGVWALANVLGALMGASDEELIKEVATLEVVSVKNIMGTEGMKAADKAAGFINLLGSKIFKQKKQLIKDLQPRTIREQIEDCAKEYADCDREELEARLRQLLAARLKLEREPSDELLSKEMAARAGRYLGIAARLTPAEMTDEVFYKYREEKADGSAEEMEEDWQILSLGDVIQYISPSRVEGEIYCRLIARGCSLHGKNFAPAEEDLPAWAAGKDEEKRRELEASDASYQAREEEMQRALETLEETKKELHRAEALEDGARGELTNHAARIEKAEAEIDSYEGTRQQMEIELGVLEGELVVAAGEKKTSAFAINKIKKQILRQREKIVALQKRREENLQALTEAPHREEKLRQKIAKAEAERQGAEEKSREAEEACAEARRKRDAERQSRKEQVARGLEAWLAEEYGERKCALEEVLLWQLSMSPQAQVRAVLKVMKEVLEAETPRDLGEEDSPEVFRLPLRGREMYLIYGADKEDRLRFLKFTDDKTLGKLQGVGEEKE